MGPEDRENEMSEYTDYNKGTLDVQCPACGQLVKVTLHSHVEGPKEGHLTTMVRVDPAEHVCVVC